MLPFDLATWLLVLLRVGAIFALFPLFSMRAVPARVRTGLAALIALLVAASVPEQATFPENFLEMAGLFMREIGIGLVLGLASRIIFFGLDMAGALLATELGLSMSFTADLSESGQSMPTTAIIHHLSTALWLTLGLHHWLIAAVQKSYTILPIGTSVRLTEPLAVELITRTSQSFVLAVQMTAPVLAVSFLISVVLSILGRAVPQMNVFSESFVFRLMGGFLVFGFTFHLMAEHITNYLRRLPNDWLRVASLLAGA